MAGNSDISWLREDLLKKEYRKCLAAARDIEEKDPKLAALYYKKSANILLQLAKLYTGEDKAEKLETIEALLKYAEELSAGRRIYNSGSKKEFGETTAKEVAEDFSTLASSLIEKSSVTWDEIGGLDKIKKTIHNSIVVTYSEKPEKVKIEGWNRLLLFGPPGTGKTLLAAATSNELDATFFNVKLGSIESKWFGESPKILRSVFENAREREPSVIFFDEVDSIASSRSQSESEGRRALLGTFLSELDGLRKERGEFVLTLTATNVPWDLDNALISRCEKRIYIPLPDIESREKILRIHLQNKGFEVNADILALAKKSEGYSGRDLRTLCLDTVNNMIEEMNPEMGKLKTLEEIKKYKLKIRPITEKDFENALSRIKPAATPEMIKRYEEWSEKFESIV